MHFKGICSSQSCIFSLDVVCVCVCAFLKVCVCDRVCFPWRVEKIIVFNLLGGWKSEKRTVLSCIEKKKEFREKEKKLANIIKLFFHVTSSNLADKRQILNRGFFSLLVDAFMIESFCFFGMLPQSFFSCHNEALRGYP